MPRPILMRGIELSNEKEKLELLKDLQDTREMLIGNMNHIATFILKLDGDPFDYFVLRDQAGLYNTTLRRAIMKLEDKYKEELGEE